MTLQLQLYNTQHSFEPKYKAPYERPHTGTVRSEYAQKQNHLYLGHGQTFHQI